MGGDDEQGEFDLDCFDINVAEVVDNQVDTAVDISLEMGGNPDSAFLNSLPADLFYREQEMPCELAETNRRPSKKRKMTTLPIGEAEKLIIRRDRNRVHAKKSRLRKKELMLNQQKQIDLDKKIRAVLIEKLEQCACSEFVNTTLAEIEQMEKQACIVSFVPH